MMQYMIVGKEIKDNFPPLREVLVGIEANEKYCPNSKAPTMGTTHACSEFKTVWSIDEAATFERMTAVNYIKVLFEEFRWGDREPFEITIIPKEDA